MSRNNLVEQTVDKIIETAHYLFIQKGYEKTSVQDIINELGLSKGAIYHHFKSKEEILYAVLNKEREQANLYLELLVNEVSDVTAKEKLKYILRKVTSHEEINTTNKFLANQPNNSKAIVENIIQTVNYDSLMFYTLIQEGVEDGSLETEYPKECAELLLLLCNVWLNPILFNRNYEETISRFKFIQFTMKQLGVDVIETQLLTQIENNLKGVGIHENIK
ncbi:MAG: TetR/AcrR family transcriptional regulator [Turicibacter sp.]